MQISDMIPGVNIINRKVSVTSINGAGGSGGSLRPLRKFWGSKEHLDWLKINLNVTKVITVQDYKHKKKTNVNCSVKAESQAGKILRGLKNLSILLENSAEGLGSRRDCCWHDVVSVFENTPTNLMVQRRVQLEHSSHIPTVGVGATCLHFGPWCILTEMTKLACPFGTMPQEPWYPGKGAKPGCIIQHNCREVRHHASYKTTRTCEKFNNWGTKMTFLSDKLWNNS